MLIPWIDKLLVYARVKSGDEVIDKLNGFYTVVLLLLCSVLAGSKQYFGSPIQCWTPAQFKPDWTRYAEGHCFVEGTYYKTGKDRVKITYYQWIPFVLAFQALLFLMPATVTEDNKAIQRLIGDTDALAEYLSKRMHRDRWHTVLFYQLRKLLYVLNICGQVMMVSFFLGFHDIWGWLTVIEHLVHKKTWHSTGLFPRVTFCDFTILELGNKRHYTVQCLLAINMLNEMIYLILWLWFMFLLSCTLLDILCSQFMLCFMRKRYIRRFTFLMDLSPCGYLLLRKIEQLSDDMTVSQVVVLLTQRLVVRT